MTTNLLDYFCECGCGQLAPIAKRTDNAAGRVKGQPCRFIPSHNLRLIPKRGEHNPRWNGGIYMCRGYRLVKMPGHPRAHVNGYVAEHVLVAEKALGRPLPKGAVIHHVNEDRADNRPENLVVCEDHGYHMKLHRRARAFADCGKSNWRWCRFCQSHDDPKNMITDGPSGMAHRECRNAEARPRNAAARRRRACQSLSR